ncbi:hypothetical protein [Streptomyces violascens]|uniref:hypothetical protein n=1 Tax=Streptomyces violascens TaxID=67381 RepID=UPI003686363F
MLLLGLLLLGATGAFIGLLIAVADNLSGGPDYGVTVLGNHIATLNSLGIFLAGIALTLIFGLGCAMVRSAGARARRRRPGAATAGSGRRHHAVPHRGRLRRRPL